MKPQIILGQRGYTNVAGWTHHTLSTFKVIWGEGEDDVLYFEIDHSHNPDKFSLGENPVDYLLRMYGEFAEINWIVGKAKEAYDRFNIWLSSGDRYEEDIEAGISRYFPPNEEILAHEFYGRYLAKESARIHRELEDLRKARSYYASTSDYEDFNEKL